MTPQGEVERQGWPLRWSEWLDWMDPGFPLLPMTGWRPLGSGRTIRCEELIEDGRYIVRAELPGVDPDKDITVSVEGDVLNITAERTQTSKDQHRSEFYYGKMTRRVTLPPEAETDRITATYRDGILEISLPLGESAGKTRVPVTRRE